MENERLRAAEEGLRHSVVSQAEMIRMKEKKELLLLEAPVKAAAPVKEPGFFDRLVQRMRGIGKGETKVE